jgi:hypothetical protein
MRGTYHKKKIRSVMIQTRGHGKIEFKWTCRACRAEARVILPDDHTLKAALEEDQKIHLACPACGFPCRSSKIEWTNDDPWDFIQWNDRHTNWMKRSVRVLRVAQASRPSRVVQGS